MNLSGGGYAATVHIRPRRGRLRGRPSRLKGRCAIAPATGLRPTLDPGASAAPLTQRHGQDQRPCPPGRRGARQNDARSLQIKSLRFQGIARR